MHTHGEHPDPLLQPPVFVGARIVDRFDVRRDVQVRDRCVQVVLVCLWRMLGFFRDDEPFSERSLGYITVILIAIFVIVFNLVVDILYGRLDPRVRHD